MEYITTTQLAEKLQYSNDAVIRKMIHDGKLKAEKMGRQWLVHKSEMQTNEYLLKRIDKIKKQESAI